jgi:hypothetical protein
MVGRLAPVERRIEALFTSGDLARRPLTFWSAEKVRLRSLTKSCLGEFLDCLAWFSPCGSMHLAYPYIFMAILVYRKMYGSERPSSNLLFDNVLVDSVLRCTVVFTGYVLGMSIE